MGNYTPKWALYKPKIAGFFRFLKEYREKVQGEPPANLIENAIQAWQELSRAEEARYTDMSDDSPDVKSSEEPKYRPHKPIRPYPVSSDMRCKPIVPKKPKKAACKPKRKKKASCKPKRKKAACKTKRKKKKKASCKPKRKAAACGKKKKKRPSCKVKRKPKMSPGKAKEKRFSFLSMFKRRPCSAKKSDSDSCSKRKSKKSDDCKSGKKSSKSSKSSKSGKKTYKCSKSGPLTANGFLNFLRDFRKKNCGLSPQDTLKRGARAWRKLSSEEKRRYKQMGCGVTTSEKRKKSALCRKR